MTIYYINGQWLTYEQAHNLGYTLQPATIINAVKADLTPVEVKKDSGTYYNPELQEWNSDLSTLNVFVKSNDVVLYRGESSIALDGYAANENVESSFVAVNAAIVPVNECYQRFGYTLQPCQDWLMEGGVVTAWFDPETELYWDDREKKWKQDAPESIGDEHPMPVYVITDPVEVISNAYLVELPKDYYPEIIYAEQVEE